MPPVLKQGVRDAAILSDVAAPGQEDLLLHTMLFPKQPGKALEEAHMRSNCVRLLRALHLNGINLKVCACV